MKEEKSLTKDNNKTSKHKMSNIKILGIVLIIMAIIIISIIFLFTTKKYNIINSKTNTKKSALTPEEAITISAELKKIDQNYNYYMLLTFTSDDQSNLIKSVDYTQNNVENRINTDIQNGKQKIGIDYKCKNTEVSDTVFYITTISGDVVEKTITDLILPEISFGSISWSNKKANVPVMLSGAAQLNIEYQIAMNESDLVETNWITAEPEQSIVNVANVELGYTVFTRLAIARDTGEYKRLTVTDTTAPNGFTITITALNDNSIKIVGSTSDGQSGIKNYDYIVKNTSGTIVKSAYNQTATNYTFSGLTLEAVYQVYMVARDRGDNETTSGIRQGAINAGIKYLSIAKSYGESLNCNNSTIPAHCSLVTYSEEIRGKKITFEYSISITNAKGSPVNWTFHLEERGSGNHLMKDVNIKTGSGNYSSGWVKYTTTLGNDVYRLAQLDLKINTILGGYLDLRLNVRNFGYFNGQYNWNNH